MSKIKRITKDCQPVFPGWFWDNACEAWYKRKTIDDGFTRLNLRNERYTYWHPDQPEPPTDIPQDFVEAMDDTRYGRTYSLEATISGPPPETGPLPLPPEVQAACERLKGYQYNEPLATDLRTLLAWVEGRKSP